MGTRVSVQISHQAPGQYWLQLKDIGCRVVFKGGAASPLVATTPGP